jgi:2-keto-4-pentenoate hydratase/2-oxohepta-3-ene-1,7-dioic acid hydratase in catechol pathway
MRFVKYRLDGEDKLGLVVADGQVVDIGFTDLRDYIVVSPEQQASVSQLREDASRFVTPERLLAPLAERCQIIYTGGNYATHLEEVAHLITTVEPVFFPGLWSAVIGPG